MSLSVTDPIRLALERTRVILFRPFKMGKWFGLGFCAFLAQFIEGGIGGGGGVPPDGGGSGEGLNELTASAREWLAEYWILIVLVGLFLIGVVVVVAWIGSRGRFMFLDGVVRNRGAVKEPWSAFAHLAGSQFRFELLYALVGLGAFLLSVASGIVIALEDLEAGLFGTPSITGLIVGGVLFLLIAIGMVVVNLIQRDFVVPTMYARDVLVREAWGVVHKELLAPHTESVVLYCLMRAVLVIATAVIVIVAVFVSCCLLAIPLIIPYIGTVLLLPIYVFLRCYSLFFIAQLEGPWRLLQPIEVEAAPEPEAGFESGD